MNVQHTSCSEVKLIMVELLKEIKYGFCNSGSHTLWETNNMSDSPACRRILITFKVKFLFILTGDS